MPANGRECRKCQHWENWAMLGQNGYGKGECRRFPPKVVLLPKSVGGDTDRATPVTGQFYWCGEFQLDEQKEELIRQSDLAAQEE
jgi:hypothetical protein